MTDAHAALRTQLAVVGAGPAGLAAATTAARAGLSVVLIDAGRTARGPVLASPATSHLAGRASGSPRLAGLPPPALRTRRAAGRRTDQLPTRHAGVVRRTSVGCRPAARAAARRGPWHARRRPLRPSRRHRALPRRLRPSAAGSGVGSPGRDGRGRDPGTAQGPRRGPGPTRGRRRHRPVPTAGGDRPRRRRGRGGLGLRGRGAELVAAASRRHPRGTSPSWSRARGTPPRCCEAASRTARVPRSSGSTGTTAVEAVTIARLDRQGRPVAGTERVPRRRSCGARLGLHPFTRARPRRRCGYPARCRRLPRRLGGRPAAQLAAGRLRGRRGDRGRRGPSGSCGRASSRP